MDDLNRDYPKIMVILNTFKAAYLDFTLLGFNLLSYSLKVNFEHYINLEVIVNVN